MNRAHRLSLTTLALCAVVPFIWIACGGKPPETPADQPAADSEAPPAETSAPVASSAPADTTPPPAETAAPPPAPPPAPPLGETDCGKCIDKTCARQVAACSKNTDCQSMVDAFHGCGSDKGAAACVESATLPTAAKPKKLATAYETCAKKALTKACKSACQ